MQQKAVRFSPYSPAFQKDPFGHYSDLLEIGPVHRTKTGIYIVVGYEECRRILSDPRFLRAPKHRRGNQLANRESHELDELVDRILLNLDEPQHGSVRHIFSHPFSNKNVLLHEKRVRRESRRLIEKIPERQSVDLVEQYASPLTIFTIKNIIGIDRCDDQVILDFAKTNIHFLELRAPNKREMERSRLALRELLLSLKELLLSPVDGTFLHALASSISRREIDEATALSNLAFLISAGFETTISLLCGGYHLLCRSGMLFEAGHKAVLNEVLRLAPPIHLTTRIVGEDLVLGGTRFEAGHSVIVSIAAACRDPSAYKNPNDFRLDRSRTVSLSFGIGAHYCLGVNLARLEAKIGWEELVKRFGKVGVDSLDIEFQNRAAIRTPSRLTLCFKDD